MRKSKKNKRFIAKLRSRQAKTARLQRIAVASIALGIGLMSFGALIR